ncbi:UPF0051 protein [Symbiodinium microadriaticum]|uniref:UPF0051 protein n=1 Tax=Symbiodinium microadriaticum TaxID=2951 RepID=A0A1Q9D2C6_SYMMI|nr:UPF0051 protein [Symbiodinium microadriaticum]
MASLTLEDVKRALLNRSNVFVVALWISQACLSVSHKRVSIVMKESPFVLTILQPVWIAVAFGIVWAAMCFRSQEKEESSTDTEAELSESDTSSEEWTAKSIGAVCLLLAQAFPGALSTVFMEYNLQRSHVSFWKLWTLINIWEVVALPPVWVASVPLQGLTFAQSPKNLLDGFQCLFVGQGSVEGADDEEIWLGTALVVAGMVLFRVKEAVKFGELTGVMLADTKQQLDLHSLIHHSVPSCRSKQQHKNLVGGSAECIFKGTIRVDAEAGFNMRLFTPRALLPNFARSLLLTKKSKVKAMPSLQIQADDVSCSHGAALTQLDKDELFYLASRGLDGRDARRLMLAGFPTDLLDGLKDFAPKVHERVLGKLASMAESDD